MPNLRGLITRWDWSNPARLWIEIALLGFSLALLIWASRQWQPSDLKNENTWNAGFCIALIATFLVGYHSYNHDMSILLLPFLLIADRILAAGSYKGSMALKALLGLMFLSPLYLVLELRYSHLNLFAVLILCLLVCLARASEAATQAALVDICTAPSIVQPR